MIREFFKSLLSALCNSVKIISVTSTWKSFNVPDTESGKKGNGKQRVVVGQRMPHLDFLALSRNVFNYITHYSITLHIRRLCF